MSYYGFQWPKYVSVAERRRRARRNWGNDVTVPIEAAVLPLLQALKEGKGGGAKLVEPLFPSIRDMARGLRRWFWNAGVQRHALHNDTETTARLRFQDLRATGIAWMAVRGDDPPKIQRRAGHTDLVTTQRYIRTAEDHRAGFGEPFPELPEVLVSGSECGAIDSEQSIRNPKSPKYVANLAGRTGLEPAASGVTGRRYNQLNYRPKRRGRLHSTGGRREQQKGPLQDVGRHIGPRAAAPKAGQ